MADPLPPGLRKPRLAARAAAILIGLIAWLASTPPANAANAHIAIAANFADAAHEIAAAFEAATGHAPILSFGSTGQIYAQISQGAPFDVFLAADQARPVQAIDKGLAIAASRFTYASGRLALYSADPALINGPEILESGDVTRIAIANPTTAPYGAASVATMQALGFYPAVAGKIVQGNTVSQTYQFIVTGNAEVGFVSLSQVIGHDEGSRWVVPPSLHGEIAQDAVLLTESADNDVAVAFLRFLRSDEAKTIIADFGYGVGSPAADG